MSRSTGVAARPDLENAFDRTGSGGLTPASWGGGLRHRRVFVTTVAIAEAPAAHHSSDVSAAELYPGFDSPEDLTLVVDLRTVEALPGVGVASLTQSARSTKKRFGP